VNAGEVERIPHAFEAASTRARARTRALAALTAVLAFATVAAWLTVRGSSGSGADQPAAIRQNPASIPPPPAVRSEPPRSEPTTAPAPAGAPPTPASAPALRGATAAAGETTSDRFDIIVASFRTEARAASVATQVADVGLPVRQRFAGGWQQVVAGPFASRGEADAAQQRLTGAGLTDTHVVAASR
jgi:cell division protein FtsN